MNTIDVKWTGTTATFMHDEKLADELSDAAQLLARLNKEKKRKGVDKLEMSAKISRAEWEGGLYFDQRLGPYIPGNNILACIKHGARLTRGGKEVERCVQIVHQKNPLEYDGPRDIQGLWDAGTFKDRRGVKVQRAKIFRTRPAFDDWSLQFRLLYTTEGIDLDALCKYMADAGTFIGLGDARSIGFGRFKVAVKSGRKWTGV
jgi:hypothetical protein